MPTFYLSNTCLARARLLVYNLTLSQQVKLQILYPFRSAPATNHHPSQSTGAGSPGATRAAVRQSTGSLGAARAAFRQPPPAAFTSLPATTRAATHCLLSPGY
uniref:Uncharacterized protein n=1 Tax=Oryza glaberrima TaxID=4538 RepID=I1QDB0_ORYGL